MIPGRVLAVGAALALAACARLTPDAAPLPLRNPTAPVASQTDVTLARLTGRWQVIEARGLPPGGTVIFGPDTLRIANGVEPLRVLGQGRFATSDSEYWVHWLDADNRTAALGDPHGSWFAILDRGDGSTDRLNAAREILAWYGYQLAQSGTE